LGFTVYKAHYFITPTRLDRFKFFLAWRLWSLPWTGDGCAVGWGGFVN